MMLENLIILYCIIIYYIMDSKDLGINKNEAIATYELKYLTLRSQSTKIQQKNLKKILKLLEKDQWILDMGVYSNVNIKTIVSNIQQSRTLKLWLGYNARPPILTEISTIDFPNLKELSLAHNQIHSIESLSFLNLPKLQEIQFRQNVITSFKTLKKLHLPQLKVASFYRNFTNDSSPFASLHSKNLKTIWLQYQDDESVQGQTLASFMKLQSSQLKSMAVATANRIRQPQVENSILRKFPNVKIYRYAR